MHEDVNLKTISERLSFKVPCEENRWIHSKNTVTENYRINMIVECFQVQKSTLRKSKNASLNKCSINQSISSLFLPRYEKKKKHLPQYKIKQT